MCVLWIRLLLDKKYEFLRENLKLIEQKSHNVKSFNSIDSVIKYVSSITYRYFNNTSVVDLNRYQSKKATFWCIYIC